MNKYFPPDWDPSQGTAHQHNRQKRRGIVNSVSDEYLLLQPDLQELRNEKEGLDVQVSHGRKKARIELPFNIWCNGCGQHIAKNFRVNSEKQQVGNYYRTAIWEFSFICPSCPQVIVMRSVPQKQTYEIFEGARPQHLAKVEVEEDNNPFELLEKKVEMEKEVRLVGPRLQELKVLGDVIRKEDFTSNRAARQEHRELRKLEAREAYKAKSLSQRYALGELKIGPELVLDKQEASQVKYLAKDEKERIKQESIFNKSKLKSRKGGTLLERLDFCKD